LFNVDRVFCVFLLCENSVYDVSEGPDASIFRAEVSGKQEALVNMIQIFFRSQGREFSIFLCQHALVMSGRLFLKHFKIIFAYKIQGHSLTFM